MSNNWKTVKGENDWSKLCSAGLKCIIVLTMHKIKTHTHLSLSLSPTDRRTRSRAQYLSWCSGKVSSSSRNSSYIQSSVDAATSETITADPSRTPTLLLSSTLHAGRSRPMQGSLIMWPKKKKRTQKQNSMLVLNKRQGLTFENSKTAVVRTKVHYAFLGVLMKNEK